jgi:hypothetical protein
METRDAEESEPEKAGEFDALADVPESGEDAVVPKAQEDLTCLTAVRSGVDDRIKSAVPPSSTSECRLMMAEATANSNNCASSAQWPVHPPEVIEPTCSADALGADKEIPLKSIEEVF